VFRLFDLKEMFFKAEIAFSSAQHAERARVLDFRRIHQR
jgi:hypothetical protein